MRRLFVRLFLGFVLVIALILGLQAAVFIGNGFWQARRWRTEIFSEYVEDFSEELDEYASYGIFSTERLEEPLLSAAEDRVSGLLLRDADGALKFAYGKPQRQEARSKNMAGGNLHKESSRAPIAVVTINQSFDGSTLHHSAEVTKHPDETRILTLPGNLEARDVTGTIQVVVNGQSVGFVDVLTFTPFGYRPIVQFLEGFFWPMAWTMVLATVLALVLAWYMSGRNLRYSQGIQEALSELSRGRHGVTLPETTVIENLAINESITNLDHQLEQNDVSRREWLNSISHDLATPVTSMKLLLDGVVDGVFPMAQETMAKLQKECDDLAQRIDRVVYYAKLLSPSSKANFQSCSIPEFIETIRASLPVTVRARTVCTADATEFTGDPELLVRAVQELIDNAAKASQGEIAVRVGQGVITVMNDGSLPPDTDFFEPWTKGDKSRGAGGNGLGLPIVGQILRLHHGQAKLAQSDGKVLANLVRTIA